MEKNYRDEHDKGRFVYTIPSGIEIEVFTGTDELGNYERIHVDGQPVGYHNGFEFIPYNN